MLASGVEIAVQQVQQTERITEDRELLSAQLNATADGHLVVGPDGETLSYDQQVLDMWGGTEELVRDSTDTELLDFAANRLENADLLRQRVDELYANPSETSRDELYLTDGRVFESYSAPVEDASGEYFARLWTFRDITDQKKRERRLNALLERTSARIYIRDREGIYRLSNRAHAAGLGFERDEVVGSHATDVLEPTSAKRSLLSDQHIFATGEPLKTEAVRTIQGERQVFISEKYPYRVAGDGIVGVVAIAREITDRKEREEEINRQNRRLKEFTSIVSHDLRNPLAVADGQLRIAQQEYDCENIRKALAAIERGEALVDDLLTLVRSGDDIGSLEPVALPELSKACWNSVDTPGMALDVQTESRIRADAGRLRQILENLYRNAAEHGGTTVRVGDTEDGFYVEDDGPGLEDTETTDVFEAGYTTSEDGTGFGLRIVKQIVTAHEWEITATEGDLGGARFEIAGVERAESD